MEDPLRAAMVRSGNPHVLLCVRLSASERCELLADVLATKPAHVLHEVAERVDEGVLLRYVHRHCATLTRYDHMMPLAFVAAGRDMRGPVQALVAYASAQRANCIAAAVVAAYIEIDRTFRVDASLVATAFAAAHFGNRHPPLRAYVACDESLTYVRTLCVAAALGWGNVVARITELVPISQDALDHALCAAIAEADDDDTVEHLVTCGASVQVAAMFALRFEWFEQKLERFVARHADAWALRRFCMLIGYYGAIPVLESVTGRA